MPTYFGRGAPNTQRHTVQDEGVSLAARSNLNFVGGGVTATDSSGSDSTVVTIPAAVMGSAILDPRLGVPQGTLLRSYIFDAGVEAWAASPAGGTVSWDSSAKAVSFATSSTSGNYQVMDPAGNITDGEFVADVSVTLTAGTIAEFGSVFRYVDDNNHYLVLIRAFQYTGGVTAILYKKVAGTYTAISEADAISAHELQVGAGARVRVMVRFVGTQISWYINEAFVGAVTDSTFTGGGKVGVRIVQSEVLLVYQAQAFSLASTWEPYLYGSGGAGTSGAGVTTIRDENVPVPARSVVDFVGSGVTATDDSVNGKTIVTIPGAGPAATGAILGVGITTITVSSAAPSSPTTGDIWIKRS